MTDRWAWRTWGAALAFFALAGGWYLANVAASAASMRTLRSADAKFIAAGHPAPFSNWSFPSAWDWSYQAPLRSAALGVIGAALIAVLVRLAAGTALVIAAVLVPAVMARPADGLAPRAYLTRALPYVALLTVAGAALTGVLHIDSSGDGSGEEMLVGAAAALLFAAVAAFVATENGFWMRTAVVAVATGLVMVSGLNPASMSDTKWAAFGTAAGIAALGAVAARRPDLRFWSSAGSPRLSGGGL